MAKLTLTIHILFLLSFQITLAENLSVSKNPFQVEDPWSIKTRQKYYANGAPIKGAFAKASNALAEIVIESPISGVSYVLAFAPITQQEVLKISTQCKSLKTTWEKVACASREVNAFFIGKKFKDWTSACQSHAEAFRDVFNKLDIPKARSEVINADFVNQDAASEKHFANKIMLTAEDGRVYAYAIDVGWFPNKVFPLSDVAIRLHDSNLDGKTENIDLPRLPTSQREISYDFRPTQQSKGSR